MHANSRIAITSTMGHLRTRQAASKQIGRLDQVGDSLQNERGDQNEDDALLDEHELEATRFARRFQRGPGVAHVIPAGPTEEQADRQEKHQRAEHLYQGLTARAELLIKDVDANMAVAL